MISKSSSHLNWDSLINAEFATSQVTWAEYVTNIFFVEQAVSQNDRRCVQVRAALPLAVRSTGKSQQDTHLAT